MLVVGLFGVIGNTLTICILSQKKLKNSFNRLLVVLALMDNLFIVLMIADYSLIRVFSWPISIKSGLYSYLFPKFVFPFNNILLCSSIYMICCIALERHTAVCQPFTYRATRSSQNVNIRVVKYLIVILALSLAVNTPRFFETELVTKKFNVTAGDTFEVYEETRFELTEMRKHPSYIHLYINWFRLISTCLLPCIFLVFFNCRIYKGIRFAHCRSRSNTKSEINLAMILMLIVMAFLFCNIPRIVINCYDTLVNDGSANCPEGYLPSASALCFTSFNHFCLVLGSSVNFVIYFSLGGNMKALRKLISRSSIRRPETMEELKVIQVCPNSVTMTISTELHTEL